MHNKRMKRFHGQRQRAKLFVFIVVLPIFEKNCLIYLMLNEKVDMHKKLDLAMLLISMADIASL